MKQIIDHGEQAGWPEIIFISRVGGTGECELLPNGDRIVRGDHKINNDWEFNYYDNLRQTIKNGIVQLNKAMGDR